VKFYELITQVMVLLQREGRVSYRALRREFDLNNEDIEDLKAELIDAKRLAVDEDGKVLVWVGASPAPSPEFRTPGFTQSSITYTPQHLADRIRAEQAGMEARGNTDGERKTIAALWFTEGFGTRDLQEAKVLLEALAH
jgi:hypothetical protein